jgi:hypothetical protein
MGSTQCLPVPWDSNFQTDLKTFIQAVYNHIHNNYPSDLPDHVVVTGINYTTQENLQPNCTTSGCGYGGNSDVSNWMTLMVGEGKCTTYSTCQSAYNGLLEGAYTNIIGYWGGNFPSSVGLASMFVNSGVASFPFNNTTALGLDLLNKVVSYSSSRSIVMNNAAQNGTNGLVNLIRCYAGTQDPTFTCQSPQPTSAIAFQELAGLYALPPVGCSNFYALLSAASAANSAFMETYANDISHCP